MHDKNIYLFESQNVDWKLKLLLQFTNSKALSSN